MPRLNSCSHSHKCIQKKSFANFSRTCEVKHLAEVYIKFQVIAWLIIKTSPVTPKPTIRRKNLLGIPLLKSALGNEIFACGHQIYNILYHLTRKCDNEYTRPRNDILRYFNMEKRSFIRLIKMLEQFKVISEQYKLWLACVLPY